MSIPRSARIVLAAIGVTASLGLATAAHARSDVSLSFGIATPGLVVGGGGPAYYPPAQAYYPPPQAYYPPPPTYYAPPPPPVYVAPRPVYYNAPPVYVRPQPIYYGPPARGYYGGGYNGGGYYGGHRHGWR